MPFLSYLTRRVVYSIILLLAVIILNFCLIHIAPGDPADVIAGEMGGAAAEMLAAIRAIYGLDRPLHEQLGRYLSKMMRGDLGHSFFFDTPVTALILARVGPTIVLVVSALLVAITVGTLLGVIASRHPHGLFSYVVTVLALVSYSAPVFWTGIMLLILLASYIPLFPVSGMYDVTLNGGGLTRFFDILRHMVLPVLTLSSIYLAIYSRLARASMLDVMGSDYIRTARAKGVKEPVVVYKHALRNALLPVVTFAGLQFGQVFSGAVLVESVFSWPGLGTLAFDSILRRDSPTLMGILFFSTLMVVVANILTDLSYRLIDPRIRT